MKYPLLMAYRRSILLLPLKVQETSGISGSEGKIKMIRIYTTNSESKEQVVFMTQHMVASRFESILYVCSVKHLCQL